jgi:hypothetical protein
MAELFIQERAAFPHHHRPLYFVQDAEHECKHSQFWEQLVAAGVLREMPRERFFGVVGDLLYGTILTNLLSGRPTNPDAQADDILDVILNGLLTDRARPEAKR